MSRCRPLPVLLIALLAQSTHSQTPSDIARAAPGVAAQASADTSAREQAVAIDLVRPDRPEAVSVERLARGLARPWSLAFVASDELLITEKLGGVRVWRQGRLEPRALEGGPPRVLSKQDSGLLDIALDPDFARTRFVYIAFAEGDEAANRIAVWRARYDGRALIGGEVIFRSRPDKAGTGHPGGRLLFLPDGSLLLTIGDGFDQKAAAQDLASHLGKTLRLTRDGAPAPGNPFLGRPGALPEIWTLGHRNAQGLALDPVSGQPWLHEHGPRGGDEINRLVAGANYGWPLLTHGIDYDGSLISERTHAPGFERSSFVWSPSVAPSGLAILRGDLYADWRGKFLVGGLVTRSLLRLRIGKQTGLFIEEERFPHGLARRVRDVREGPDGLVYLLTDDEEGELLRLRPEVVSRPSPAR
jgi:aldose sugar dehydrogenase